MTVLQWGILLLMSLAIAGCKFKPPNDMEEQPSAHPSYKPSAVFSDGTTARPVPYGTVPRARSDAASIVYADVRDTLPANADSAAESMVIPFPVTAELLSRGQERFDIYCAMCHARLGNGDGMIVHRGLTPPPSFHIDRLRAVSDGHLYNVISNGYGQMFSYNDRVSPEDRWMIVAYIRALQAGTSAQNPTTTLTAEDRRKLEGTRP
jgi:hypothetical protein